MKTLKNRLTLLRAVAKLPAAWIMVLLFGLTGLAKAQPVPTINAAEHSGAKLSTQQTMLRSIYTSQIGVREKGANAGTEVETYLRYVNLPKGNPWCAAFVCWALGKAGISNPRSGWSPDLFRAKRVIWAQGRMDPELRQSLLRTMRNEQSQVRNELLPGQALERSPFPTAQLPRPSDVFGLYFPEKGRIAHVGFIDEWNEHWVTTVEGNTNILGSREGDGVYRKRRLARSIYKVARYIN